jgi:hybrid cluster-associated redox disulfide protein
MKKTKITANKQMQIGELLKLNPNVKEILMGFGLHCFGCPMSQMETIEEAAAVHGVDVDLMMEKINEFLNN